VQTILWHLHLAATWGMVGIIWQVQLVTYPSFLRVGRGEFREFHTLHTSRITAVVGPLMGLEIMTAVALLAENPLLNSSVLFWVSLMLLLVNGGSTLFLQVPLHSHLERNYDTRSLRRLMETNWIRTACWTLRGVLLLFLQP
jgi:hypothetical protein